MSEKVRRVVMSLAGVILTGVAVSFLRKAGFGTDPFTGAVIGLGKLVHLSYDVMYPVIIGLLLVLVFFVDKHYLGIATIFNLVIIGPVAENVLKLLDHLYDADTMPKMILTFAAAIVILCFSAALYITADLGVSSYDAISLIMADKGVAKYRFCRIATDVVCVIIGFLCKSSIGIGTVVTAFGMGPLTQWFIDHVAEPLRYGKQGKPETGPK